MTIKCCRFHLGQTWWRKIHNLDLSCDYKVFRTWKVISVGSSVWHFFLRMKYRTVLWKITCHIFQATVNVRSLPTTLPTTTLPQNQNSHNSFGLKLHLITSVQTMDLNHFMLIFMNSFTSVTLVFTPSWKCYKKYKLQNTSRSEIYSNNNFLSA